MYFSLPLAPSHKGFSCAPHILGTGRQEIKICNIHGPSTCLHCKFCQILMGVHPGEQGKCFYSQTSENGEQQIFGHKTSSEGAQCRRELFCLYHTDCFALTWQYNFNPTDLQDRVAYEVP